MQIGFRGIEDEDIIDKTSSRVEKQNMMVIIGPLAYHDCSALRIHSYILPRNDSTTASFAERLTVYGLPIIDACIKLDD